MKERFEKWIYRQAIKLIKEGYGADCETSDLDDFYSTCPNDYVGAHHEPKSRCASCRAKEAIEFLEYTIDLIDFYLMEIN
jgi:hypothetical protein